MKPQLVTETYSEFSEIRDLDWYGLELKFERFAKTLELVPIGYKKGATLLDVGCQYGIMAIIYHKMGFNVSGVDHSVGSKFKKIWEKHCLEIKKCDIMTEELPFPDQSFDYVTFFGVLEHLHHSPQHVLMEMKRVLKPGGELIVATPNSVRLPNRIAVILGGSPYVNLDYFFFHGQPFEGHVREYTCEEVKQVLEWTGFSVVFCRMFNFFTKSQRLSRNSSINPIKNWLIRIPLMTVIRVLGKFIPSFRHSIFIVGKK